MAKYLFLIHGDEQIWEARSPQERKELEAGHAAFAAAAGEPAPLLKGFDRVELAPGESRRLTVTLDQRAFFVYAPDAGEWTVVPGAYAVLVGDSSQDLKLSERVRVS